jgi:hypothetical protein
MIGEFGVTDQQGAVDRDLAPPRPESLLQILDYRPGYPAFVEAGHPMGTHVVFYLDKDGGAVFLRDAVNLVLTAEPGEDASGLHLVAMLPEENPHKLLKLRFRAKKRERSPQVCPVGDGRPDDARAGTDHLEDRGCFHAVRHSLFNLAGDPFGILHPHTHPLERPLHLPPIERLTAAVGLRDVFHKGSYLITPGEKTFGKGFSRRPPQRWRTLISSRDITVGRWNRYSSPPF